MELRWWLRCVADCNCNFNCNWSAHSGWFGEKPRPTQAPGRSQCPDQVRWSRISRVFLPAWTSSKVTSNPFWNERVLNNRRHLASSIEPYLSEGLAVTQRHREHDDGRGRFKLLIPSKKRCYIVFAPDYYLRCPQPSSNPRAKVTKAAEPFGDALKCHAHLSRLLQWQIEITCNYFGVETPRTSFGGNSSLKS